MRVWMHLCIYAFAQDRCPVPNLGGPTPAVIGEHKLHVACHLQLNGHRCAWCVCVCGVCVCGTSCARSLEQPTSVSNAYAHGQTRTPISTVHPRTCTHTDTYICAYICTFTQPAYPPTSSDTHVVVSAVEGDSVVVFIVVFTQLQGVGAM